MSEQTLLKQIAREYYNVIYGAKLNFASLDICEKLPGVISFLSMSLGILGLSFQTFNDKILASALLIAGIVGLMIKPRELNKDKYLSSGKALTSISKRLEVLHGKATDTPADLEAHRTELETLQAEHGNVDLPAPVFLSSWYAHYKLFSEQNNKWFCDELKLTFWKDKLPLSLRLTVIAALLGFVVYLNPLCFFSETWDRIETPCTKNCSLDSE